MSLTKEFNANSQKRRAAAETETWSETHHISKYFTVTIPAPQQTIVRRGALRFS
jgi:hypothetical protein